MNSQPNIPFASFQRLLIDDSAPADFRFYAGNVALDLTGKIFRIVLYPAGQSTVALTLEDGDIDRPEGLTAGLLRWNADANRNTLTSMGVYFGYLFELIGGKREPRAWFKFQWLAEPPAYVEGLPVEPPEFIMSYGTLPPVGASVSVYGSGQPAFADADEARDAVLPTGLPLFITIGGKPGFKDADEVYYLILSPA
ncbi:hypothetical protein [Fibrella forsythiae]|uniref:Uncharacterized protein n=1 Tax=Fibrella forsythiae TaxID=2817061 RepID=A0ABS3JBV2_9BACT|nr:hypothetical protein [Fibrella forsythiae]MBO0947483.1 hypothetical protein [Fibrella forsythiae]